MNSLKCDRIQSQSRCVVILPIEKYNLLKLSAQTLRFSLMFFTAREGNDRETVDGNNSVKSKTTFIGEHKT